MVELGGKPMREEVRMSGQSDRLQKLSQSPEHALELGKAAEHIVCADLILQGYRAFLSDQGLSYDLIVDLTGKLIRVQVKAACFMRNTNAKGRAESIAYTWSVRRRGKNGQGSRLSSAHCDVVALVALDTKKVAYARVSACSETVTLRPGAEPGRFGYTMEELWSFEAAANGFPQSLSLKGRKATLRRNGSPVTRQKELFGV